jgi:hypothetical protein
LGETSTTLDFDMVVRACESRITERSDLDWKQKLPLTAAAGEREARLNQQRELAKDVAAMANSGGGMIVYGVAELRVAGTSAADHVEPVGNIGETALRSIRQVIGNLIYPPVAGAQLLPLAPDNEADRGVLVLLVPDSPDTPHLIHPKNGDEWFGVPYRHGPDTEWMVERQVAKAYQAREMNRRRRQDDFDARFSAFADSCRRGLDAHWTVAMSVPESPAQRPRDLSQRRAHHIFEGAWRSPLSGRSFGPANLTGNEATRRGLLSFNRTGRRHFPAINARARARVEVHGDGTVAVAFTRGGAFPNEGCQPSHVATSDIEQTGLDLFALLWASRQALGITGDYSMRITVDPPTQIFRMPDPIMAGHFAPFRESDRVFAYRQVDGPILANEGLESALSSWLDVMTDAVHQTGFPTRLAFDDLLTALRIED